MGSLVESIVAFENPVSNPHGAAKNLLASHARKHVKVVLSGEGADEWLGGYAYMRLKKIRAFSRRHPKLGAGAQENFLAREGGMNVGHLDGASSNHDPLARSYFGNNSPSLLGRLPRDRFYEFVTGERLGPLVGKICHGLSEQLRNEHPGRRDSELDLNLWVGARTDLLHYILANVGDRQEMAHSLEGRTPYLDTNLVKVAAAARETSLIRGLREKFILREVGKKYLKAIHHRRGKKPFFSPLKHLYLRKNAEVMNGYIEQSREETPWLHWKNIDHLLRNPRRKLDTALEGGIITLRMALFSLGVLKAHLREPGCRAPGFAPPENARDLAEYRKVFPL
jgi:asparagine synthase (glutamine-hydrolysing)